MKRIIISILDIPLETYDKHISRIYHEGYDEIHLDVIDETYNPNTKLPVDFLRLILLDTRFRFQIHFMVANSFDVLKSLPLQNVDSVFISLNDFTIYDVIEYCKGNQNIGIVMELTDSLGDFYSRVNFISSIYPNEAKIISSVVIMTVPCGRGGQKFSNKNVKFIEALQKEGYRVGIDGSVNLGTIKEVCKADFFIVGSAYFHSTEKSKIKSQLLNILEDIL